jgi:hypothetical protein
MEYTRAERLGAAVAAVFCLLLLVISVDVMAGGWLLGGPAGLEDQEAGDDDG